MSASVTDAGQSAHRYARSRQVIGPWSGHSTVTWPPLQADGRQIRGRSTHDFYHGSHGSRDTAQVPRQVPRQIHLAKADGGPNMRP